MSTTASEMVALIDAAIAYKLGKITDDSAFAEMETGDGRRIKDYSFDELMTLRKTYKQESLSSAGTMLRKVQCRPGVHN
ncbi:MAG: hypothetical protein JXR97_06020 [Planctomycetes bacterium]|nr:hypothetical protein [Planctomycetota bacterium]